MLLSENIDDVILAGGVWSNLDHAIRERIIRLVVKDNKWKYDEFFFAKRQLDADSRDYIKETIQTAGVDYSNIIRSMGDGRSIRISLNKRLK